MTDNSFSFMDILDIATDFVPGLAGVKKIANKAAVITDALGITQDEAVHKYNKNPEAFVQELKNKAVKMQENTKQYAIEVEDRKSARQYAKESGSNIIYHILCFMPFIVIAGCIYVLINHTGNETSHRDVVIFILGIASASLDKVYNFYFGSSMGSKNKSKELNDKKPLQR